MPKVSNIFSNRVERGSAYARAQQSLEQQIQKVHKSLTEGHTLHGRPLSHARDPMVVTTRHWENTNQEGIPLWVNPSDMQWNLPRRGTVVKTLAGAVRNTWRNRYRGTYYDEGTVGITFQTGNIMPSAAYDNADLVTYDQLSSAIADPRVPPGLWDFYKFMELLNQPKLWGATENRHVIYHRSRVFPEMRLEGFFMDDSFAFSEIATDGNQLQWTATFQIYRSTPKLWHASELVNAYTDWVKRTAQDEAYGNENVERYKTAFPEGLGDVPDVFPVTGPNAARAPTTVASSPNKTASVADKQAAAAASRVSPRTLAMLGL